MLIRDEVSGARVQVVERQYSVAEAAEIIGTGVDYVYDRINDGSIRRRVELGSGRGKMRIPASALQEFLDARTFEVAS